MPNKEREQRGTPRITAEEEIHLRDVMDIEHLQALQDAFAEVTGITTVVIGPDGQQLTRPSNLYGFCALMQKHPQGQKKCICTNIALCEKNRETGDAAVMLCPHSGLTTASVPILLNGKHLGSWIIGQVRLAGTTEDSLAGTETELNIYPGTLDEVRATLPVMDRDEFEKIFEFLKTLNQNVIRTGYVGMRMKLANESLRDLTERLDATAKMLRKFTDATDIGMYVCDYETGQMLMANRQHADYYGVEPEAMVGNPCWTYAGNDFDSFCTSCPRTELMDENGQPTEPNVREVYNERLARWLRVTTQLVRWVDGQLATMVTYIDITAEHKLRAELARLAYYDRQMQLPNSLKLLQDLQRRQQQPGRFLVCFDIAGLRRVNDVYGRETGDRLLLAVLEWVQQQGYGARDIYRIEGDEFCLYFEAVQEDLAQNVAAQICERFQEAWVLQVQEQSLSVLCGVSAAVISLASLRDVENVITVVERTLDISRSSGTVAAYDEEMDKASRASIRMELSLKSCVKNGMQGFAVHFQPIVDPAAGTWKALEALCRWTDPESGPVPPPVFIAKAEQLGLIRKLGFWVLEEAIRCAKSWKLDEIDGFFVSVNLSPDQVMDEGLVDKVVGLLKKYDFPGVCLNLEVTESTQFTFNSYSLAVIDNLRFRGVRFALDDFGTGYSSFNNLKNLPVSLLKTEREFIGGIEDDVFMQYFFYSMAELAHAADMKLIAEGIETQRQLEIILKNGADFIQGYYFSKPLPAEELEKNLDKFVTVDPSFYTLGTKEYGEEQIFSGKEAYMVSPTLFRLLNQTMQMLLSQPDINEAYARVLEQLGAHFDVSRAQIFLLGEDGSFQNTQEWCAEGIGPRKDELQSMGPESFAPSWLPTMERRGMVVASDIAKLPMDMYDELLPLGIKAIASLPLYDGDSIIGFICLQNTRYREWLPEEVSLLRNLAMTMASTRKKEELQRQLLQNHRRFSDVLGQIDVLVMAIDPETFEIIWSNENHLGLSGDEPLAGQTCYAAIHNKQHPCEFCRRDMLQEGGGPRKCSWDLYHPVVERYFLVNTSLTEWENGREVLLEYAMDVTDIKHAQKKLEYFATTDSLTETANRNTTIGALRSHLWRANKTGTVLSVVFLDVDRLKHTNDTYGHALGDELIKAVVGAVRAKVRGSDVVGRYGGDEFVVLLPGCSAEKTAKLMEDARAELEAVDRDPVKERFTFSYGVVESTELPYREGEGDQTVNALLDLADSRMREYKISHRVPCRGQEPRAKG